MGMLKAAMRDMGKLRAARIQDVKPCMVDQDKIRVALDRAPKSLLPVELDGCMLSSRNASPRTTTCKGTGTMLTPPRFSKVRTRSWRIRSKSGCVAMGARAQAKRIAQKMIRERFATSCSARDRK